MRLPAELDSLPTESKSAAEKLREALAMYEEGVALQRLSLRRRHPDWSEERVAHEIERWLERQGET